MTTRRRSLQQQLALGGAQVHPALIRALVDG